MFKEMFINESDVVSANGTTYSYKTVKTQKGSKYETPYWSIVFTPKDKSKDIVAFKDALWYHSKSDGQYGLAKLGWTDGNDKGNSQPSMTTPYLHSSDSFMSSLVDVIEGNKSRHEEVSDSIHTYPKGTKMTKIKSDLS